MQALWRQSVAAHYFDAAAVRSGMILSYGRHEVIVSYIMEDSNPNKRLRCTQKKKKQLLALLFEGDLHPEGCLDLFLLFMKVSQVPILTKSNMLIKHYCCFTGEESNGFAFIHLRF